MTIADEKSKKEKQGIDINSNTVDVSEKTIDTYTKNIENEFLEDDKQIKNSKTPQETVVNNPQNEAISTLTEQCLKTTLSMFEITVDDTLTREAAKSYSALFLKYFPDVEALGRWKEEIACVVSTFALGGAIMIQVKQRKSLKQPQEPIVNDYYNSDRLSVQY